MNAEQPLSVRDRIEEDILSDRYKPGDRLEELVLAAELGVSRTPIREALRQLQEAGLIEVRPRRGAVVRSVSPAELLEMFEVMGGLEALAGRLAARRLDETARQKILETHEACRAAAEKGTDAYYYENERFHLAIHDACKNHFLVEQASTLHRRLKPYRRLQLRSLNRMAQSLAEHEAIVEAILSGDGEAAALRLWNHVTIQADRFHDFFASISVAP